MHIRFKRPRGFVFVSGQWVRTSCPAFACHFNERHAFSIASSPQDTTLELYIKAVGPWTWKLHQAITLAQMHGTEYPEVCAQAQFVDVIAQLHMDGAYGAGNQDWAKCEVAIMVGGGIGVTPYASILKDMVLATHDRTHRYTTVNCKKVCACVWP
jgi:dual oxidase